jgi:ABC-type multidrug transport system fused ATPase/permease subunit
MVDISKLFADRLIKLKFWFFYNSSWILSLVCVLIVIFLRQTKEPLSTTATVVGTLLTLIFFLQKQALEELRLFRELFKEFNERYDKINENLSQIAEAKNSKINEQDKKLLIDYFNLCAEEYLYYTKGYIDPVVWRAWHNGMKAIINVQHIRDVWNSEKQTDSYYGLSL